MTPQANEPVLANASRRPYYPRYSRDELSSQQMFLLPPDARCFINDMRDWSWAHEGIENSEVVLFQLGKKFGFSKQKTRKLITLLPQFFDEKDGFFYWESDEQYRAKVVSISSKRRISGRLGGLKKSGKEPVQSELPLANARTEAEAFARHLPDKPPAVASAFADTLPPPPEQTRPVVEPEPEVAGGGGEVEKILRNGNGMGTPEAENRAISEHCHRIGIPAPSPGLSAQLRAKFPGVGIAQVIENLPRFDGQTSPGLWRDLGPESLTAEAQRQKNSVPKKKSSAMSIVMAQYAAEAAKGG
jgi:hypothetical protein